VDGGDRATRLGLPSATHIRPDQPAYPTCPVLRRAGRAGAFGQI